MKALVIGMGDKFQSYHFYALSAYTSNIVGYDPASHLRAFWEANSNIFVCNSLDEALAKTKYDVAIVTGWSQNRRRLFERLFYEAGVRLIVCEPPIETNMKGLKDISHLVRLGLHIIPCHLWAYSPLSMMVCELSAEMHMPLGIYVEVQRTAEDIPKDGGFEQEVLFTEGYHSLYMAWRWARGTDLKLQELRVQSPLDLEAAFIGPDAGITLKLTRTSYQRVVKFQIRDSQGTIEGTDSLAHIYRGSTKLRTLQFGNPIFHTHFSSWYREVYQAMSRVLHGKIELAEELWEEAFKVNRELIKDAGSVWRRP